MRLNFMQKSVSRLLEKADIRINGSRSWDIHVHNDDFFRKLFTRGSIALGESYVDGWWDAEAIDQFVYRLLRSGILHDRRISFLGAFQKLRSYVCNSYSLRRSQKDVSFHYDIGNYLFECMLDSYMNYSCGYWKHADNLHQAQLDKMGLICRKLALEPGMTVLDIGCGWGGLAKYMAEHYQVHVTGITISQNQYEYAMEKNASSLVRFQLQDYREHQGTYDRLVSVGMFEHVGCKNHRTYMHIAKRWLKPDGLFLLHFIAKSISERRNDPWIDTYMFPGTIAVSAVQVTRASEGLFYIQDWHNFGSDYYKTIQAWYRNVEDHWQDLGKKYDERFHRAWTWYLQCCSATALARTHHLWQIVLSPVESNRIYERVS